ncbi:MAG: inorganic phosphate transporter [Deltaproteobacteria bacterium]|jgi:PiT family inorganic phosphate transporter|nr:inorganic phosphate transporter [Deltaproteobacteria bacterium]
MGLAAFAGFFTAFSMGANDVSNAMAPAVSAKAVTLRQAVVMAAVLNCLGAIFLGAEVANTIASGIIDSGRIADHRQLMVGMLAALLSSGLWVLVATFTGLPVSSTHSVVGGIIGMGVVIGGPGSVRWGVFAGIAAAWLISPVLGGVISHFVFTHIRKNILYSRSMLMAARRWAPIWLGLTLNIVILSFMYKTPLGKEMRFSGADGVLVALGIMLLVLMLSSLAWPFFFRRFIGGKKLEKASPTRQVEELFRHMQTGTACYVALSHGANDVANAVGPAAAIYLIASRQQMFSQVEIPLWLLLLGGLGIALGTLLMGRKVMATVGEKLTRLNNSRGFSVAFGAATTVLLASNLGLPISTTHASVGAVVGVGLARGFASVDFRTLSRIVLYWVLTVPIAGVSSVVIYLVLSRLFL